MATEELEKDEEWCLGYMFWRGQYTARNQGFLMFLQEFIHKLIESKEKTKGNADWFKWLLIDTSRDPIDYIPSLSKDWTLTLEDMLEVKSLLLKWNKDYPYYNSMSVNGLDILNEICNGNFPPQKWTGLNHGGAIYELCCGSRYNPVFLKGSDSNGFETIAIDCDAEISIILSEVKKIVEKKKNSISTILNAQTIAFVKEELKNNGSAYKLNGDESRAIGLMMYDYYKKNGDPKVKAYRWVKQELMERGPKNFGKSDSDERQYLRWLNKTIECVNATEVLEI